jgi:hypothetical protein
MGLMVSGGSDIAAELLRVDADDQPGKIYIDLMGRFTLLIRENLRVITGKTYVPSHLRSAVDAGPGHHGDGTVLQTRLISNYANLGTTRSRLWRIEPLHVKNYLRALGRARAAFGSGVCRAASWGDRCASA